MDDIVTRLRNHARGDFEKTSEFMLSLAADEIERLRAEKETTNRELVELRSEVQRLSQIARY